MALCEQVMFDCFQILMCAKCTSILKTSANDEVRTRLFHQYSFH
uniref:Uncharacterized protein n=1 Tax=Arundo donax TaxID=35708 RepID=A0A0A9FSD0_ARUDO